MRFKMTFVQNLCRVYWILTFCWSLGETLMQWARGWMKWKKNFHPVNVAMCTSKYKHNIDHTPQKFAWAKHCLNPFYTRYDYVYSLYPTLFLLDTSLFSIVLQEFPEQMQFLSIRCVSVVVVLLCCCSCLNVWKLFFTSPNHIHPHFKVLY